MAADPSNVLVRSEYFYSNSTLSNKMLNNFLMIVAKGNIDC